MKPIMFISLLMGSLMLLLSSCAPEVDIEAEQTAVKAVIDGFFEAVKNKDVDQVMGSFAEDPDIAAFMPYTGEDLLGAGQVKDMFSNFFATFSNFNYSIIYQNIKILGGGNAAWFLVVYDEAWEVEGQQVVWKDARWSGVAEKRNGNWKIVRSHLSFALPGEGEVAEVRDKITEINKFFAEKAMQGDAAAVAAFYAEDAIYMSPNAETIKGREAIQAAWSNSFNQGLKEITLTAVDLVVCKDYACEVGNYELTMQPRGRRPSTDKGKYVVLWKRQPDGSLRLYIDIWNTSLPAR